VVAVVLISDSFLIPGFVDRTTMNRMVGLERENSFLFELDRIRCFNSVLSGFTIAVKSVEIMARKCVIVHYQSIAYLF